MADIASLIMKVDASQIDAGAKSLDKLTVASKKAEQATETAASALKKLGGIAASAFAVWNVAGMIKDATLLAARYETLGISMYQAGRNAGYSAMQMDGFQKALEKTGISMVESRNTLIQMSAANMDLANATKLARAAQDLAVVGNVNSSEAFNRLVYGIKSGQTEILRTLGLNVQFDESYKTLAASLHKTAAALTEQEKMQARTNITMEAATQYAGIYEAAMTTAAKQIASLERYHDNLKVVMGSTFTEALAAGVAAYTTGLKYLNAEAQDLKIKGDLKEFGRATALSIAAVADSARMAGNTIMVLGSSIVQLGAASVMLGRLAVGITNWKGIVADYRATVESQREAQSDAMVGMSDNLKIYDAVAAGFAKSDAEDTQRKQKKLITDARFAKQALMIMKEYSNDAVTMRASLEALGNVYGGDYAAGYGTPKKVAATKGKSAKINLDPYEQVQWEIEQAREKNRKEWIVANEKEILDKRTAMEKSAAEMRDGQIKVEASEYAKHQKAILDANEKTAKEAAKQWETFTGTVQRTMGDELYQVLNGNFSDIGDAFKRMVLRMAADAAAANLTRTLFGGESGGGLLGQIGAEIGDMFSFAGGGFTGGGSRSGGVDGMGGFPAILHPNETVIDHTRGQGVGASVTVVQNITIDSRSDASAIISAMQRAKEMAKAEIMSSLQRGGNFASAVGRA